MAVLAKHASCVGNFTEVCEQILSKVSPESARMTYSHSEYWFHYITDDRIVYLCITDKDFERTKAYVFLDEIKKRFVSQYGARAKTALPYAMNSEFQMTIASQMKFYSDKGTDQVAKVQAETDELKHIMVKNIDNLTERGEKLELLVDRTDQLNTHAVSFRTTSRNLARSLWWKNVKMTVVLVIFVIVLIYVITCFFCGFFNWHKCIDSSAVPATTIAPATTHSTKATSQQLIRMLRTTQRSLD